MVELKKELPEIFEEFAEQRKNSFLAIKEVKEKEIPVVGVFCTYLPREIPNAMGAAVVGLCSVSDETIPDAEKDLPRNLCPLIKSSYGFAKTDKCPFFYFSDLVVGETTCDGKKKMYEMKVIRAIEDNGGVVVCFENCTGMKPLAMVDEENPDVYDALARKYLNIGCSCMSPNKNRLDLLDELIDDFQVDGVVDLVLQACHTYNVETALVKKLVKDKKGIPYTVVETDYSQADIEQINTRMAAFIEML